MIGLALYVVLSLAWFSGIISFRPDRKVGPAVRFVLWFLTSAAVYTAVVAMTWALITDGWPGP